MLTPAANPLTAFGLSSSAGLNAYIPLLIVGILEHGGAIHLTAPYDTLGQPWAIGVLAVLVLIEFCVDKVPGLDHLNDLLHTIIRPVSGALLFAMASGLVTHVHPGILFALGLMPALAVHATKATARPVVHVTTAGFGGPVISLFENVLAVAGSLLAVFFPVVFVLFAVMVAFVAYRLFRHFKRGRNKAREAAATEPVVTAHQSPLPMPELLTTGA